MFLHNVNHPRIELGNTLWRPQLLESDRLAQFNVVVAHPPFSFPFRDMESASTDRFNRFWRGIPPKNNADYAFISHMIETTYRAPEQNGRVGIIVSQGVLFRGGSESMIRRKLIEENLLDAVIGLPANLFYATGIPAALLIFKRNKADNSVLFIDASRDFEPSSGQNRLRPADLERIVTAYRERRDVTSFAYLASLEEIARNEFILSIPRYVFAYETPEQSVYVSGCPKEFDLFISYSRKDKPMMERISQEMLNAGLSIGTDESLEPGTVDWQQAIEHAIENSCAVVALLSPDAKQSQWVKRELMYTQMHQKPIFSLIIRGDEKSSVPLMLVDSQYVDIQDGPRGGLERVIDTIKEKLGVRMVRTPYLYGIGKIRTGDDWHEAQLGELVEFITRVPEAILIAGEQYPVYTALGTKKEPTDSYQFEGSFLLFSKLSRQQTMSSEIVRRVSGRFSVGKDIVIAKSREDCLLDFVYYSLLITNLPEFYLRYSTGVAIQSVSLSQISAISIGVPGLETQKQIVDDITERLKIVEGRRTKLEQQLHILNDRAVGAAYAAFTQRVD